VSWIAKTTKQLVATLSLVAACHHEQAPAPPEPERTIVGKALLDGETDHGGVVITLSGPTSGAAVTDSSGNYTFGKLARGSYAIIATAKSTTPKSLWTAVTVADANDVTAPDLKFTPLGDVSGRATIGAATGNAGITVLVAGTSVATLTDDTGAFTLRGVPTGSHDVVAALPGWLGARVSVKVRYAASTTVADLVLAKPPKPTGSLRGTAKLSGETDSSGIVISLAGPVWSGVVTDASGKYAFDAIPDGPYTLTAAAASTLEGAVTISAAVTGGGATSASDIAFTPVGTLTGKATLGTATTGNAGIVVFATGTTSAAFTDDAGNYSLANVPTGAHAVRATKTGYASSGTDAPTLSYAATVTVPSISLTYDPSVTGSFAGNATMIGQDKHGGIAVKLEGTSYAATTADDGSFTIDGVAPGKYAITLESASGVYKERIPSALVLPGSKGFLVDGGGLSPFSAIRLVRGVRVPDVTTGITTGDLPSRSRDGKWRSWTAKVGGVQKLMVASSTDGLPKTIDSDVARASFSSDSTHILYVTSAGTLYAAALSGGAPVKIADDVGVSYTSTSNFGTTADGTRAIYTAISSGAIALFSSPIGGGAPTKLSSPVDGFLAIAPAGSAVAFTVSNALKVVPAAGGTVVDIALDAWAPSEKVQFSPDGKTILYRTLSSTNTLKWAAVDGSASFTSSTNVDTYAFVDSTKIVTSYYDGYGTSKYILDAIALATGTATRISSEANYVWSLSPDGKVVAYRVFPSGVPSMALALVAGGTPTVFATPTASYSSPTTLYFSPDSKRLLYFTDGNTLFSVATSGTGTATKLGAGIAVPYCCYANSRDPVAISSDSKSVFFVAGTDLKVASIDGAVIKTLASPALPADLTGLARGGVALSPDGLKVAYFRDAYTPMYVPTTSVTPVTPVALVDVAAYVEWLGPSFVVSYRQEPSPLTFQSGLYLMGVP